MKGDFSRISFDPRQHFSRVLMQQGRVLLDADWNEQTAILLHYLRTLAVDLMGPHGGPRGTGPGGEDWHFAVSAERDANGGLGLHEIKVAPGHYYVAGILCENDGDTMTAISELPSSPYALGWEAPDNLDRPLLIYLDVSERFVSALEAEAIREPGLAGLDTAGRAQVLWQVRVKAYEAGPGSPGWPDLVRGIGPGNNAATRAQLQGAREATLQWLVDSTTPRPRLKARALSPDTTSDPCQAAPEARYRGLENQLYRVEVHRGDAGGDQMPTFKWSRDNGTVAFAIESLAGTEVILPALGRDDRHALRENDWVEITDDRHAASRQPGWMAKVKAVQPDAQKVTIAFAPGQEPTPSYDSLSPYHPILRRWDQRGETAELADDGALAITRGAWLDLEDGIQVWFDADSSDGTGEKLRFHSGDYWLIPARTATGGVEWPMLGGEPQAVEPHGVEHHFAPLAVILDGADEGAVDLRSHFSKLGT